jgi:hypothetical protein
MQMPVHCRKLGQLPQQLLHCAVLLGLQWAQCPQGPLAHPGAEPDQCFLNGCQFSRIDCAVKMSSVVDRMLAKHKVGAWHEMVHSAWQSEAVAQIAKFKTLMLVL